MVRHAMNLPDEEFWKAQRRYKRANVLWPATLLADGERFDCIILDLSANGARLRVAGSTEALKGLVLEAPRFGSLMGDVAWRRETELGLRFNDDPEEVAALLGDMLPAVRCVAEKKAVG
jgi:hypothetical protein